MKRAILLALALALTGCLHPRDTVGATRGPEALAACRRASTWHNALTIVATTLGAGTGAESAINTAESNKLPLGIAAASTGLLAGAATIGASIAANDYASAGCQ